MDGLANQIELMLTGAALMLVLMGLGIAAIMPGIDRWSKRFFIAFFMVNLAYIAFCILDWANYIHPKDGILQNVVYYFETLFASALIPMSTVYQLHCCGKDWSRSSFFRTEVVLWVIFFTAINIAPFTTWFYYASPQNPFNRGPLYPLLIALLEAMLALNLAIVIRWRSTLSKKLYRAFLVGIIPMAVVLFIHFFASAFVLFGLAISACMLSMFAIIMSDQVDQSIRQQREIAHQRASIMVLQMRPHFIYNTMTSIYYLCKQNPDLAQQVTLDFTTYLRKNFTAIASEELIPFTEELEHTRAYLAVEQSQFEDRLLVDYDTPHVGFLVPPLTLQPIVENAVKHGMNPDSDPLHINIQTSKVYAGSKIIVENDGVDFAPIADDEPHIALKNIQQRLEIMCHGEMAITPREGGGTIVEVTIP